MTHEDRVSHALLTIILNQEKIEMAISDLTTVSSNIAASVQTLNTEVASAVTAINQAISVIQSGTDSPALDNAVAQLNTAETSIGTAQTDLANAIASLTAAMPPAVA